MRSCQHNYYNIIELIMYFSRLAVRVVKGFIYLFPFDLIRNFCILVSYSLLTVNFLVSAYYFYIRAQWKWRHNFGYARRDIEINLIALMVVALIVLTLFTEIIIWKVTPLTQSQQVNQLGIPDTTDQWRQGMWRFSEEGGHLPSYLNTTCYVYK